MSADILLGRLDGVRRVAPARWVARCPAHEDRTPSLSIRELDDGRVLVHDFGGCSVEEVLGAVGLEMSDLFPERPIDYARRERRPFNSGDVLEAVIAEVRIAAVAASNIAQGAALSPTDHERLMVAAERLQEAGRLVRG